MIITKHTNIPDNSSLHLAENYANYVKYSEKRTVFPKKLKENCEF